MSVSTFSGKGNAKGFMSTSLPDVEKAESEDGAEMDLHLDVQNVSKKYHLWESPRTRLIYGVWSQVPRWAPQRLRKIAQKEKGRLGRDFYALQNVSFQLHRGESLAILGRNGSGKSTLLQIICGILQPSAGTVVRHCQRVAALLELGSGFNPDFTGRENVFLNGTVLGLKKEEIESKFDRILEFAEIGEFIDQPVKTYSSGMMVRLAFAVQVQLDPELLIVDEALAVGDIFFQQKCFAYMRQLKERGCSFLIVSHDTGSIQQFCDRGIVLVDGRKHFEGSSLEAIRQYRLTEKVHHCRSSIADSAGGESRFDENHNLAEPERWFEPRKENQIENAPATLVRWSCVDESGKVVDHFFPGQRIRLFAEFECAVPVREASAGFGIRDRTGQMIHGKHLYQTRPGTKISLEPPFVLRCEFSFPCLLMPGEYTVEFGFVDIYVREAEPGQNFSDALGHESYEVLYVAPPVGSFAVVSRELDPIKRKGHFGIVDLEAESDIKIRRPLSP
jgi:lipopolysaccharide transport system ATP-binding protein